MLIGTLFIVVVCKTHPQTLATPLSHTPQTLATPLSHTLYMYLTNASKTEDWQHQWIRQLA
jgi:hypothetical protein